MKQIFICSLFLFSAACNSGFTIDSDVVTQARNVSEFNKIDLAVRGELYLNQGNETSVVVEADIKKIDYIITEVSDGKLKIRNKELWQKTGKVKIYITTPNINELTVSCSGKLLAVTDIKTQNLETKVSGSGSINLLDVFADNDLKLNVSGSGSINIHVVINNNYLSSSVSGSGKISINNTTSNEMNCKITGSGNIEMAGKNTKSAFVEITGSGNFNANNLEIDSAEVKVTGSGNATVYVIHVLTTRITGSGNVNYKGQPLINASSTGSGKTKSMKI